MYSGKGPKKKNGKVEIKRVFKEFCESISLHGYGYLFIGKDNLISKYLNTF